MTQRQSTTRQNKVHTKSTKAAIRIFAANARMNQILIEHLDYAAGRAKSSVKNRITAAILIG